MNQPLGQCIGNALEVRIEIMRGKANADNIMEVALALAAEMLVMADATKNVAGAKEILQKKLARGEALGKSAEMTAAQGGDAQVCEQTNRLRAARQTRAIVATASG
jgi:pyrimidine-nucleoside phosphorylase